ncbi:MAG: hypothetical protein FWF99_01100 [Desulfovibrionaceae bacterium]|nr:hypothetical protein [Desulfovibrionaceae bacterium]
MSKIFELYGHRMNNWDKKAAANCSLAWCPFMDAECDGGGNRYSSALDLRSLPALAQKFPGKDVIQSGVCSLLIREGEQPWIVCPRRLLFLKNTGHQGNDYQRKVKEDILKFWNPKTDNLRVWSEVKMKIGAISDDSQEKFFDYTFDYIISGSKRTPVKQVAALIGKSERTTQTLAEKNGYTLAKRGMDFWIDDFPGDPILILEIMTSSTSGGDKKKRTQISMACEDAILHPEKHNGPGINYRQVWARMVSQLIVKSQVGIAWEGMTLWLIQDVLADYISNSTALNLQSFLSEVANEVNILAFGYGKIDGLYSNIIELKESKFYSGPIDSTNNGHESGFVDIIKIGAPPPKEMLWRSLFLKSPCATFVG